MKNGAIESAASMSTGPRRFILQALDSDHGSPVLEAMFLVTKLEDLRSLLEIDAGDDPELEGHYTLDAAELAAITERFGIAFDPEGREVVLCSWHSVRLAPYLVHTGFELALLLEGRKQLARMSDAYPPDHHLGEEKFDRYVAQGVLHKEVVVEPFERPSRGKDGQVFEGQRTVYYTHKGEEWRIKASKLIWDAATKSAWNEDFERMQGMLFGYEEWQNDWWLADRRSRRPDDDAARHLLECTGAVALVRLNVRSLIFLDLVNGQSGPDYAVPAGRIKDLNRNIVGEIEIVARHAAQEAAEL